MIEATVGILTFNSAKSLNNCLNSVKNFREILVLDGGSTDQTLNIAKKYNCKIKRQPQKFKFKNNKIKDFSKLKDLILKLSNNDLVLFLDSDEILNKSVLKKIIFYSKSKISKKKYYSFLLGRFPIYKNKIITQKTILYPNFQERLVYKSNVKNFVKKVHEKPLPKNKNLISKKIPNQSIIFPINTNKQNLYKKYNYYYQIEKKNISNGLFFRGLQFIIYRLLVISKHILQSFFFNSKVIDNDYKKFEKEHIKLNLYFSLKLLINLFIKKL